MSETAGVGSSETDVAVDGVKVVKPRKPRATKVYNLANAELGSKLRLARRMAGLSLRDVGDRLGVSAASIHSYESGRISPKAFVLKALCGVIGVDVASILQNSPEVKVDADVVTREIVDLIKTTTPETRMSVLGVLRAMTEPRAA